MFMSRQVVISQWRTTGVHEITDDSRRRLPRPPTDLLQSVHGRETRGIALREKHPSSLQPCRPDMDDLEVGVQLTEQPAGSIGRSCLDDFVTGAATIQLDGDVPMGLISHHHQGWIA